MNKCTRFQNAFICAQVRLSHLWLADEPKTFQTFPRCIFMRFQQSEALKVCSAWKWPGDNTVTYRDMDVLHYPQGENTCDNSVANALEWASQVHIKIVSKMRSNAPRSDPRISDWLRNLKCCKHFSGVYSCVSNNSDIWHSVRPLAKVPVIILSF